MLFRSEAHGVVGNWVRARAIGVRDGLDYKQTGQVEKVNAALMKGSLDDNLIPIVPNVGWSAIGKDYNLNSGELAVAVAEALGATKLFFVGRDSGIPVVAKAPFAEPAEIQSGVFSNLDREEGGSRPTSATSAPIPKTKASETALMRNIISHSFQKLRLLKYFRPWVLSA